MKRSIFFLFFLLMEPLLYAQQFASWKGKELLLDNGFVRREVVMEGNIIITKSLMLKGRELNFDTKDTKEFSFLIDGKSYDGTSGWRLVSSGPAKDDHQGEGATVTLKGMNELSDIELKITFLLYPNLPVIRKRITLVNKSGNEIRLEDFDVEKLKMDFSYIESVVYASYGRQKHLGNYIGNWDDPILAVHSYAVNAGIILGNEAPGVLKRIDYNTIKDNADIGLTHTDDIYAFRKYIKPGDSWTCPGVFVIPYENSPDPLHAMNNELADFERRNMGLRIFENRNRPSFMYNNYRPFGTV